METTTTRLKRLILQLVILILLYTLCRLLFILVNRDALQLDSFAAILRLLAGGLRFDLSIIAFSNALFIAMVLLPVPAVSHPYCRKTVMLLFVSVNSLCLLINLADIVYFPYIHKRSQADVLLFITGKKGNDLLRLLPSFLVQYWYLLLLYCSMIFLLYKAYKYTLKPGERILPSLKQYLMASAAFLAGLCITIVGIRGGLQEQPLSMIHATEMTEVKNIPAILNSPFSILKTWGKKRLPGQPYFPDDQLPEFNKGIHLPAGLAPFSGKNVIIIVMESLSKKYTGYFGGEAETPFLDSLFTRSLVFPNAFANAYESVQGIPAILSAIPSWQEEPYLFSPYVSNTITSLPALLKEEGYQTHFFHGGFNGTMGFDSYAVIAGMDHYYGMDEFNNKKEYDGYWGIWDEPFLQYTAKQLSAARSPFFATIFTLNTHHPFIVPPQYQQRFNKHRQPFLNCVEYLDFALNRFFAAIKNQRWYNNTLFVITADHTALNMGDEKSTMIDNFSIPLVFFSPSDTLLQGTREEVASQIDIMPSVLDLLHYPKPYFSLGASLFTAGRKRFSIGYSQQLFQYIDSSACYHFNGEKALGFYDRKADPALQNNLYKGTMSREMLICDSTLKRSIQFFNQCMIHNKMHLSTINSN